MDVQTVTEAMAEWLGNNNIAAFGTNLFIGQVPSTLHVNNDLYWIVTSGGGTIQKLKTGEKVKQYFLSIYYRASSGQDVERKMFQLEELLNCSDCVNLTGFEVVEVEATTYPTDVDVDSEDRRVGMVQANIKIYKKEC